MTRNKFNAKKEFYKIYLPDSIRSQVLTLSFQDSCYLVAKRDSNETILYHEFTYCLQFKSDTIKKTIAFIPHFANPIQKRLLMIFENVWKNPSIVKRISFDLKKYEMKTEKEIYKYSPPPPLRSHKIFVPPNIRLEK